MVDSGRILVADDEVPFLRSLAELLRRKGYDCECAEDAAGAMRLLRANGFDLLIADIKMPGNAELEFVRDLPHVAEGLPVILVTGYPSLETAIQSVGLPVEAYLVKPLEFDELLAKVRDSMEHSRILRRVRETRQRMQDLFSELDDIEKTMTGGPLPASSATVDAFFDSALRALAGAVSDLGHLKQAMHVDQIEETACHLMNCRRAALLTNAIWETIGVLENTKGAFKSRALADLRKKLEALASNLAQ